MRQHITEIIYLPMTCNTSLTDMKRTLEKASVPYITWQMERVDVSQDTVKKMYDSSFSLMINGRSFNGVNSVINMR